jgi:hypothetical protein
LPISKTALIVAYKAKNDENLEWDNILLARGKGSLIRSGLEYDLSKKLRMMFKDETNETSVAVVVAFLNSSEVRKECFMMYVLQAVAHFDENGKANTGKGWRRIVSQKMTELCQMLAPTRNNLRSKVERLLEEPLKKLVEHHKNSTAFLCGLKIDPAIAEQPQVLLATDAVVIGITRDTKDVFAIIQNIQKAKCCLLNWASWVISAPEDLLGVELLKTGEDGRVPEGKFATFRNARTLGEWISLYYYIMVSTIASSQSLLAEPYHLNERCSTAARELKSRSGFPLTAIWMKVFVKSAGPETLFLNSLLNTCLDGHSARSHECSEVSRINYIHRAVKDNCLKIREDPFFGFGKDTMLLSVHGMYFRNRCAKGTTRAQTKENSVPHVDDSWW